jgi:hypothetical protein
LLDMPDIMIHHYWWIYNIRILPSFSLLIGYDIPFFPPADNDRVNDKVKILAIAIGYKLLTIVYHRLSDTLPCGSEKQVQMKGQSTTATY